MYVMVMPAGVQSADVIANGQQVARVAVVKAPGPFVGFDGQTHTGERWLPEGVDPSIEGPVTRNDAALLALALAGFDHAAAAKALGYGVAAKTRMQAAA